MTAIRRVALVTAAAVLAAARALAQTPAAAPVEGPDPAAWSFTASASTYIVPDDENYVQPTVTADRRWLHLEARVNYEDRDTGSAWFGGNFSVGSDVTLEITPMVGLVFGNTTGVAPGYKASLQWRALDLYSETEYVFDTSDSAEHFLYTWSEAAVSPVDWLRLGFVVQRTKVYRTPFDIQRGGFAAVTYKQANFGAYLFDSGASRPTVVLTVGATF